MMSVAGTRAAKAGKDKSSKTAAQNAKSGTEGKNVDGPNPKIQPTAEQMRLAQIINDTKESEDPELKNKIDQVIELTGKSRDEAVVALHDSDNDPNRAIDMLLEGDNDQGEWEMSGKKKKNRQANSVSRPADGTSPNATVNNKENRNRNERGERRDSEKEQEGIRNRGPPRMNRGGGPSRSWRGRESEKNERNLEDSRNHERSTEGRGRGRMMNGPGRGRGRGGPRSRTFQNRGTNHGGFPKSIDTWSNSTAEQVEAGGGDSTMSVGNWPDSFPQAEDWDNEDWNGSLTETKVFTPSVSASSAVPPLQDSTNTPQSIDLAALLQKSGQSTNALPAALPNSLSNSQQHSQFLSQYNQQATESLKSAVGIQTSQSSSVASLPSAIAATSRLPPGSISIGNQQRPKPQRTRLPPPSKIPSSAVEMPDDAIESLDVQFGGVEFGSEPSSFEFTSENSFQTTAASTGSVISNHITSMANSQTPNLNASLMSSQVSSSNLKTQTESAGRSAYTAPHATVTSKDLAQSSLAQSTSTLTQNSLTQSALSQSSLSQTQKTSAPELIPFSQTERKATTPFANQRSTQGIEATLSGVKGDTSGMSSSYGSQNSHTASYQSSYQSQKPSSAFTSHQSNLSSSNNFSHSSLPGHQSGIGSSQTSLPQSGLSTSPAQTGFSASQGQTAVSFSAVQSATSTAYQPQTQTSFSTSAQSVPSSYQAQVTASFTTQAQNTFPSQSQSTYGSHPSSSLSQSGSAAFSSTSQPQNSAYGSTYGSSSVATVQTHTTLHATPITTSKLTSSLVSVKDNTLDSSQHSFESCHATTSSTNLTTLTTTTSSSLNSSSVNVASTLGLATSTSTSSSTANASKGSMSAGKAGLPSMPPGVPAVLGHHQYIMSQASMPFYSLQQPMYSFEDIQMLQRLPPLATGYYDMTSFQPATSITGRESGLATVAYTGADGKFSRGDAASPVPTTLSQQQTTTQHQQPFINAAALPPGYGYYYATAGGMVPGSFPQYGAPIFPMPPVTNATSTTQFQQKPTAYASHAYNSGYDNISQTQDYKGGYGSGSQNQGKGVGGSSSTSGGSSSGADISGSVYSKTHTQLGKSFDKPGFPAGTPPPFNMPGTQTGPMGAPSTAYAPPPFIAMLAHHQQHPSPMLHHQLHQDSQGTSSQRSNQSGGQQKPGQGSKPNYSAPSYWAPN